MPLRHASLRRLHVFEAVARLQSFSRAAQERSTERSDERATQPGAGLKRRSL
jgi:hypothetical protein